MGSQIPYTCFRTYEAKTAVELKSTKMKIPVSSGDEDCVHVVGPELGCRDCKIGLCTQPTSAVAFLTPWISFLIYTHS